MSEIALIACSKKKKPVDTAVCALDLYQGQLFTVQWDYASTVLALPDEQIFIMSALYELVKLFQPIAPYDTTLLTMSKHARLGWADRVADGIARLPYKPDHVHLLGGKVYVDPLRTILDERKITHSVPHPSGLGYAKQVQWYKEQVAQCGM